MFRFSVHAHSLTSVDTVKMWIPRLHNDMSLCDQCAVREFPTTTWNVQTHGVKQGVMSSVGWWSKQVMEGRCSLLIAVCLHWSKYSSVFGRKELWDALCLEAADWKKWVGGKRTKLEKTDALCDGNRNLWFLPPHWPAGYDLPYTFQNLTILNHLTVFINKVCFHFWSFFWKPNVQSFLHSKISCFLFSVHLCSFLSRVCCKLL